VGIDEAWSSPHCHSPSAFEAPLAPACRRRGAEVREAQEISDNYNSFALSFGQPSRVIYNIFNGLIPEVADRIMQIGLPPGIGKCRNTSRLKNLHHQRGAGARQTGNHINHI
jgi:hypothetical protein